MFWGDNLQVMSHMLKEYRGQVDLIYIDSPFDSKADYKKIEAKGIGKTETDVREAVYIYIAIDINHIIFVAYLMKFMALIIVTM